MSDQIKYYFKETTNQILVSGSSTVADMNILLNSSKDENILLTGPATANNTVKLSSLGEITTYVIDNNGQVGGDTTITVDSDQELWLYRGWQPVGTEDANAYRYNPFLHRPYKAYILTETGGGSSAFPWSPEGLPPFSNFPGGTQLFIPDAYDEKFLASNGSQTQDGINSTAIVKGNFTVSQTDRGIHPWIFTRYSAKNATRQGSTFYIYKENTNSTYTSNYFTSLSAAVAASQPNAIIFDSATVASITEVTLGSTSLNQSILSGLLTNIAQSKPAGELVFTQGAAANTITGTVTSVVFELQSGTPTYKLGLSSVTSPSATIQYTNNSSVDVKFQNYPQFVGTPVFQEELASATNATVETYPTITLANALYTYTSSIFDGASSGQNFGLGFSQFGLYADLNWSVRYQATNDTGNTVRIYYTDTSGTLKFYDLATGFIVKYYGLSTPVPYFDPASPGTGFENIIIETSTLAPTAPESSFNTRVNDVYIAYSSSLSQSIDGLYVFNQIPQSDVQVTVSMYLNAWTGSDDGAKYGDVSGGINVNTTYSISPDLPHYGAGETGDRPTWTTASIRLYTGSYPNAVPDVLDDFYVETAFEDENIHISGLAITASFEIPKDSITLKKCLSVALQVSTGSNTPATDVENSLVVSEYSLEFNTPGENDNDGSVPVFLDGALSGGETLANTPDCQPLYNVYVTDETLRRNPLIQEVEYNIPEDLILTENEPLIPTQYPFLPGVSLNSATNTYAQSTGQITTSGNGVGIALTVAATDGGNGIIVTIENPGSGYKNGDMISISAQTLIDGGLGDSSKITQALEIVLNIVYGIYNPSNFRPILENTAIKSSVPESNYTQLSSITPRYLGARSTADHVNSVIGLGGESGGEIGFGTLPVIDYKTAFFAYCDQVVDPYPTVNDQTLFNIKYLINEGGDPKQPNLSPYTAFDIEGSWEEGGVGRVGINQISGSTQYDALNNLQPIGLVAKQIVPIFWSQTSSIGYADDIPMSGKYFNDISNQFIQYGMTQAGDLYNSNNEDDRTPTLGNNFFQSANGGGTNGETYFLTHIFSTAFEYGKANVSPAVINQASASFAGAQSPTLIPPDQTSPSVPKPTPGTATYAEVGEIFFSKDYFATQALNGLSGTRLSNSYTLRTNFIFPSSPPRTNKAGSSSIIGNIKIRLQYLDQGPSDTPTSWPTVLNQINTARIAIDGDVILKLHNKFEGANPTTISTIGNEIIEINLTELLNSDEIKIVTEAPLVSTTIKTQFIFTLQINASKIETYISSIGRSLRDANYATYEFSLKSNENIISLRRFRWNVSQTLEGFDSTGPIAKRGRNKWNPTIVLKGQANAAAVLDPPIKGPFISSTISGNKISVGDTANKIPLPAPDGSNNVGFYWKYYVDPTSGTKYRNILEFQPELGNELYDKTLNGDIYFMGTLPYVPDTNVLFPGGKEPSDTAFPELGIPFQFQIGDEVRFLNSEGGINSGEKTVFKITEILPPSQTTILGGTTLGKLRITFDDNINLNEEDLNFFLFRRIVPSPNTIYIDKTFPYGTLPTIKKFVDSTNQSFGDTPAFAGSSYPTQATSEGSGSFIEYIDPLRKSDNTPAGILFPEYPTALIDLTPDEILSQLRDNKLID